MSNEIEIELNDELDLQEPKQVKLKDVNFYIITDKNSESVFKQLKF